MKLLLLASLFVGLSLSAAPKVGDAAPLFEAPKQDGKLFKLEERRGKGWTVLFFYPKAGTPGCTKQACAFRDAIKTIREKQAEVFGMSADTVEKQAKFHAEHKLQFDLLADPKAETIEKYGAKFPLMDMAKRWTFILDPDLKIRWIDDNVDPAMDPKKVSEALGQLQAKKS